MKRNKLALIPIRIIASNEVKSPTKQRENHTIQNNKGKKLCRKVVLAEDLTLAPCQGRHNGVSQRGETFQRTKIKGLGTNL